MTAQQDRPSRQALLQFPCDYPFKIFGSSADDHDFAAAVYRTANSVMPVPLDAMKCRSSAQGHYLCVTILVRVESFAQIEALYAALRTVAGLKFLL